MKRLLAYMIRVPLLLLLVLTAVTGVTLFSTMYTYYRLTDEALIARVWFQPTDDGWIAHLNSGDFCTEQQLYLQGDQWRIDARFLKWKPSINMLGVNARYRLERIESRQSNPDAARTIPPSVHVLRPDKLTDMAGLFAQMPRWLSPIDTVYGSSAYDDMEAGFEYFVYRSQSGLIIRREPMSTLASVTAGTLSIRIEHDCGKQPAWKRWQGAVSGAIGKE